MCFDLRIDWYTNKTYPNYSFTFKEGTLTIKEEAVEDDCHLDLDIRTSAVLQCIKFRLVSCYCRIGDKAETDGMMHIMGPNENTLALNRPGKIIYGDHFTIRSLQDDSSSINVNYTFEVDNTIYYCLP